MIEFCTTALSQNPYRVGQPLFGALSGCHVARRGTYRIVYRIDDATNEVQAIDIAHRGDLPTALTTRWDDVRRARIGR